MAKKFSSSELRQREKRWREFNGLPLHYINSDIINWLKKNIIKEKF